MSTAIWFLLGLVAATLFLFLARSQGAHREQATLAQGLIIAALIYVGFAAIWGNGRWLAIESGGLLIYGLFVLLAWRYTMRWLAVGWAAHPLWDILLHWLGQGQAIAPAWYVIACLSFDLVIAGYILVHQNRWKATP